MMQVTTEDTFDNYVICRGYDTRIRKFVTSIPVAKPFGNRFPGQYVVGQVIPAILPLTGTVEVSGCSGLGQNPGVTADTQGHPADLLEDVELLYAEDGTTVINWMLLDSGPVFLWFELKDNLEPSVAAVETSLANRHATAYLLDSDGNEDTDVEIEVWDHLGKFRGRKIDKYGGDHAGGSQGCAEYKWDSNRLEIHVMTPHALLIRGAATSSVTSETDDFTIDDVEVMNPVGGIITDQDPAGNITVYNVLDGSCDNTGEVIASWNETQDQWEAILPKPVAPTPGDCTVISFTVNQSTVAYDDVTFSVDNVAVISPDGASTPSVSTVRNLLGLPSVNNAQGVAFLIGSLWFGIPKPPTGPIDPIEEIDYTGHQFVHKSRPATIVLDPGTLDSNYAWHDAVSETVITGVRRSGENLQQQEETIYTLEAATGASWVDWPTGYLLTTMTEQVVTEVDYNTTSHQFEAKGRSNVIVFAADAESAMDPWHAMTAINPLTSVDYTTGTHSFDLKKTQNVYVVEADSEDAGWTTWHATTYESTIITDIDRSGTSLRYYWQGAYFLEALTVVGWETYETLATMTEQLLTDIEYDTVDHKFKYKGRANAIVFAADAESGFDDVGNDWLTAGSQVVVTDVNADTTNKDLEQSYGTMRTLESLTSVTTNEVVIGGTVCP
jgi:hypothetical protein